MSREIIHYTNNEITVIWKPKVCIHSKICWKGLIEVFNPKERPWVKMEGANTERIIEQVKQCPSGALSYEMNNAVTEKTESSEMLPPVGITKVKVTPGGPYLINTPCVIIHADGKE